MELKKFKRLLSVAKRSNVAFKNEVLIHNGFALVIGETLASIIPTVITGSGVVNIGRICAAGEFTIGYIEDEYLYLQSKEGNITKLKTSILIKDCFRLQLLNEILALDAPDNTSVLGVKDVEILKNLAKFGATDKHLAPILEGVYTDGKLWVATNRVVLKWDKCVTFKGNTEMVLPAELISYLKPIEYQIYTRPDLPLFAIVLKSKDEIIVSQDLKVLGEYPKYKKIFNRCESISISIQRKSFLEAIKGLLPFAIKPMYRCILEFKDKLLKIQIIDDDTDFYAVRTIPCIMNNFTKLVRSFDLRLIHLALDSLTEDTIVLRTSEDVTFMTINRKIIICPLAGEDSECTILPGAIDYTPKFKSGDRILVQDFIFPDVYPASILSLNFVTNDGRISYNIMPDDSDCTMTTAWEKCIRPLNL